jgi:hypothetical protein
VTPSLWFLFGGRFVCAPPKCGGTSLYRAALNIGDDVTDRHVFSVARTRTEFYSPDEVIGKPAVMALRDPVSRFASLWRDKCRNTDENRPALAGLSPEELMSLIEDQPEADSHWLPQSAHYRAGVEIVHYKRLFSVLGLPRVEANKTEPKETDPGLPVERILSHYCDDVDLYRRLSSV